MLISRVSDEGSAGEGAGRGGDECRAADELFDLIAGDHRFDIRGDQSLSTTDLVILYKNIDVDTKLVSEAAPPRRSPNQHVESIVYHDERESDSDVSEIYSNEDLREVFSVNDERIDLINNFSAVQHPLCHKFGDIEIQSSNITMGYNTHFLFKEPYVKQFNNVRADAKGFDSILPASLLDYICCTSLEDSYSFYMDNMIKYVQHTIEQLRRISNGDYLTDRAREKWTEVAKDFVVPSCDPTKALATSVSIPIHVMGKANGHARAWDDIVHSEVDVRSLSKILEKKIIIEVPKLICGLHEIFRESCPNNLIISCKKDTKSDGSPSEEKKRVDVVLQIKPSGSEHVISDVNSIMILHKISPNTLPEITDKEYQDIKFGTNENIEKRVKIVEINDKDNKEETASPHNSNADNLGSKRSVSDISDCSLQNDHYFNSCQAIRVSKCLSNKKGSMKTLKTETEFTQISPDELHCTIQRLNIQTPVPEESEELSPRKNKSSTRVRIKSPYENKSFFIDEKKRKKLLEIRERREKRKTALSENCRVSKHKNSRGAVLAQPSSSVTKLSITNKSFYNSIYGESLNHEMARKSRKLHKKGFGVSNEESETELFKTSCTSVDKSYLCDGNSDTAFQMQKSYMASCNSPISAVSSYNTDDKLLRHLIISGTDSSDEDSSPVLKSDRDEDREDRKLDELLPSQSACILVPENSPKENDLDNIPQKEIKDTATSVGCRQSIDKIYQLLKKISTHDNQVTDSVNKNELGSTIPTDSGTSLNHQIISSYPSSFNLDKKITSGRNIQDRKKKEPSQTILVPKVIIGTKAQSKMDSDRKKSDRKRNVSSPSVKVPDNPLKAISQLLHEIDNVQKTRHRNHRKVEHAIVSGKEASRQNSPTHHERRQKTRPEQFKTAWPTKPVASKEKRVRPAQPLDPTKLSHQMKYLDDRNTSRLAKRNISDIIDEVKEANGEAVRGPTKPYSKIDSKVDSRLSTLAQPKKPYVQTQREDNLNKYGRISAVQRVQRSPTLTPVAEKNIGNTRNKRKVPETASVASAKPTSPARETITRPRRSASNSPARRPGSPLKDRSFRQIIASKSPDLKKKMVAVESYVNSHYGRVPINTCERIGHEVQKSRVPLIPNDIELASLTSSPTAEESTALGKQLHYMVDTMINTNAPALSVLTECKESTSKLSDGLEKLSSDSLLKIVEPKSESDYPVDIFEDKNILTAVASIPKDKNKLREVKLGDGNMNDVETYRVQPFNSTTEIRKLENALYQQMSVSAFPKRLRIKNLTLTPKQSLQQVIMVQSGDAGSLLVKSSLSQSLRTSDSKTDSLSALKPLATLSNTRLNWGFTNIPLQVATIGYAFPTYQSIQSSSISPCSETFNNYKEQSKKKALTKDTRKLNKTSQCFKGVPAESCLEQATQASTIPKCHIATNDLDQGAGKESKAGIDRESEQITETYEDIIIEKDDKSDEHAKLTKSLLTNSECKVDGGKQDEIINPSENINQSTSLDILMGLLNEIRKITGESLNKDAGNAKNSSECMELEVLLNNSLTQQSSVENNCRDLVCVSSLAKLKQIDSKASKISLNFFKDENKIEMLDNTNKIIKDTSTTFTNPRNESKAVSVDIAKQYESRFTDAPSCFFPVTITHSTNFTDSATEVFSVPSTQSVYSFAKYEPVYSNSCCEKVFELQKPDDPILTSTEDKPNESEHKNVLNAKEVKLYRESAMNLKLESLAIIKNTYSYANILATSAYSGVSAEWDPVMKMKRDILVTVYSVLVFTVFAALSFPQVFYQV